jgi:hypothetical protein
MRGGPRLEPWIAGWMALYPIDAVDWLHVVCRDRTVYFETIRPPGELTVDWSFARGDARNGGADRLRPAPTATGSPVTRIQLAFRPNPGTGPVDVRWRGVPAGPATIEIYDLRGRRVWRHAIDDAATESSVRWSGRDLAGRTAAAGAYLVLLRHAGGIERGRIVLAR